MALPGGCLATKTTLVRPHRRAVEHFSDPVRWLAQLGILVGDPGFDAAKARIQTIASLLAEQKSIPAVASCLDLISAVATDDWWQDVTVPMIEMARKRLRGLVSLIDTQHRSIVYTDFADTAGDPVEIARRHGPSRCV